MRCPSISFYTLGCRTNQSETAVLQNSFEQAGYRVRSFGESTDVVVVNTCTVTANSESDARRLVNRIVRQNPKAQIALVGCQAQLHKETLATWPNVRWVIGTAKKMDLVSVFLQDPDSISPTVIAPPVSREFFSPPVAGIDREHTRANIKIQDGCDEFCSFCEIPYARGRSRSRDFKDILTEANALVAASHKELVITGINVGKYSDKGKELPDVVSELIRIPGLVRVRISSIEPTTIPEKLLQLMQASKKVCRHLHVPLQSGSDEILEKMRRPYSSRDFRKFLNKAFKAIPDICLGTDVVVGFPGETEKHFNETLSCLEAAPVHYFHVFSYSDRTMAKSRLLSGKISPPTIQKRSQILRALGQQKRQRYYESMLGRTASVLFEQKKGGDWTGLTDNFLHIRVRSDKMLHNQIRNVRLEKVNGTEILGELAV